MTARSRAVLSGLLILITVTALFNVSKAVHMDDTAYLQVAEGILAHPLRPMSVEINWERFAEPAYVAMNQPPLFAYVLAGTMFVFGESEWALHAVMALIAGLAIAGFYRIAERVAPRHSLLLTTLLALGPAFLPGQNLMTDVPLLATWLLFIQAILKLDDLSRAPRYWLAGAAVAIACMVKYTSIVLIPVLVLILLYRRHYRALWVGVVPTGTLLGWSLWNYAEYGGVHLMSRPATLRVEAIGPHLLEWLAGLGVAAPFGLLLLAGPGRGFTQWLGRLVPIVVGAVVFASTKAFGGGPPHAAVMWGVAVGIGLATVWFIAESLASEWRTARSSSAQDHSVVLSIILCAAAGMTVLVAPFMAMRHVLLAIPAVLLLCGRSARCIFDRRALAVLAVALTVGLGIALAVSDYQYAAVFPRFAKQAAPFLASGRTVWSTGHWGWQWYAHKAGLQIYDQERTVLNVGDYAFVPSTVAGAELLRDHESRLRMITRVQIGSTPATYIRTVGDSAGYYSFYWKNRSFPFCLTDQPLEAFTIYIVDR